MEDVHPVEMEVLEEMVVMAEVMVVNKAVDSVDNKTNHNKVDNNHQDHKDHQLKFYHMKMRITAMVTTNSVMKQLMVLKLKRKEKLRIKEVKMKLLPFLDHTLIQLQMVN